MPVTQVLRLSFALFFGVLAELFGRGGPWG